MLKYMMIPVTVLSVCLSAGAAQKDEGFTMRRGTNISHWLSQSDRRGEPRQRWFTEKDVELIASLGFGIVSRGQQDQEFIQVLLGR